MHSALEDWIIWEYKEQGMLGTKHYLVNMHDPSGKEILCIMLDTDKRPST
jgi:hypothetical protein